MHLRRALVHTTVLLIGLGCPVVHAQSDARFNSQVTEFYNRITFLSEVKTLTRVAQDTSITDRAAKARPGLEAEVRAQAITYQISNLHSGKLADIADQLWFNYTTPEVKIPLLLDTSPVTLNITDPDSEPNFVGWVDAQWKQPNLDNLAAVGQFFSLTVGKAMEMAGKSFATPNVVFTHYAAYTITVTYTGKTIGPYQAMILFGKNAKGEDVLSVQDQGEPNVGGFARAVFHDRIYPEGLLRTHMRDAQAVTDWLSAHAVTSSSCSQTKPEVREVCCNADRCGVTARNITDDLAAPLRKTPPAASAQ